MNLSITALARGAPADPGAATSESLRDAGGHIYAGWRTAFASMVGMTLGPSAMLVFCFGSFVPALEREFGWGVGAISFGATLTTAMVVVASLVAGALVDRFGARRLVLTSIPLFGAAVAALSLLTPDIRVFYGVLVLASLAGVGTWPVAYNRATALWFDRRLGMSLGIANVGIGLGAALLPVLVSTIVARYGWRTAYLSLGTLAIVIPWPVAWVFLKDRPLERRPHAEIGALAPGLAFGEARRTHTFWLVMGGFVALGAGSSGVIVHQVRILVDTGMTIAQATGMQAVLGLSLIVGRVCTGWLLDRLHVSTVMTALCLAAGVAIALLAAGAPSSSAIVCAAMVGFVVGAEFDVLGFLVPRYFGRRAFGLIYGAIFAGFQIASAASVGLLGWWRGTHGSYVLGLGVIVAALGIGALLFSRLGAYRFAARSQGD